MAIQRLFIANRGEIAVRIIKAARALGIQTVQAYSEGDAEMLAVKLADDAFCLGAAPSKDSSIPTNPPGNAQRPLAGCFTRCTRTTARQPPWTVTMATSTATEGRANWEAS